MPIIECESCKMKIVLFPKYDNYKGKIECDSCASILKVRIKNSKVIDKKLVDKIPSSPKN